jgi:hypothetical protein
MVEKSFGPNLFLFLFLLLLSLSLSLSLSHYRPKKGGLSLKKGRVFRVLRKVKEEEREKKKSGPKFLIAPLSDYARPVVLV